MILVSVIICSHNPRPDHLQRVLEALRRQTFPTDRWELLLVDNASDRVLATEWDLSWHSLARHIREEELGLTAARLRGIEEARGEILIFVDDDNVIDNDYLQTALAVAREYPFIGAWGGAIRGEFEVEPESWLRPLLVNLAIREVSRPLWSNNPQDGQAQPCGAGLCVRNPVAVAYQEQLRSCPARRKLDRIGPNLSSCGDSDLIQTSCDLGQGFGNFPQLRLTHLIPQSRVDPEYLIRLTGGITASLILLHYLRGGDLPSEPSRFKTWARYALTYLRTGREQAWIFKASQQATREGIRMARKIAKDRDGAAPQETIPLGAAHTAR